MHASITQLEQITIIITVPLHKSSLYPSMCAIIIISGKTILFLVTNVTDLRPLDWPPYALNYLIISSKLAWDVGILQKFNNTKNLKLVAT